MRSTEGVLRTLGGADLVGRVRNSIEMAGAIRRGLPYASLESVGASLQLSRKDLAEVLQLKVRTLDRRKNEGRLKPIESDRLFRLARVFAHAAEVLESHSSARGWLETPNRALGGRIPRDLLDTEAGANEVDEILDRIEYGVFG